MKHLFLALVCAASLALVSCAKSQSEAFLDNFEDLVEELEGQKGKLTAEELTSTIETYNQRYKNLGLDNIDANDFSAMQKIKLVALTARWTAALTMSSETLIKSSLKDLGQEMEESGAADELRSLGDELQKASESGELQNAANEAAAGLQEAAEKMKEAMQELQSATN